MLKLKTSNSVAIDYETTGFNPYKGDKIFAFVVTNYECESNVFRFDNISDTKNEVAKKQFDKYHFGNSVKIAHNAKFEMGFTSMYYDGELPESNWHDTYIMSKMLRNNMPRHKLEILANLYFKDLFPEDAARWEHYDKEVKKHITTQKRLMNNYPKRVNPEIIQPMLDNGIKPLVTDRPNYGLIPVEIMKNYQISDGVRCMLLFRLMFPKMLKDEGLCRDYANEMRLLKTVQKMEQTGMMVHARNSNNMIRDLSSKLEAVNKEKKKLFGFDINLDSTDQLQKHLFGYINPKKHENLNETWKKIDPAFRLTPITLTDGGAPSASKDNIEELIKKNPDSKVLDLILKFRSWSKGRTMIQSYLENAGDNLIIHPTTNTNEARTGRQSVSSPSLQNVSKKSSERVKYIVPARECFRPRPNYVYFLADYSGIEMRLIIAASGEQYLIDKLNEDMDYDVHVDNGVVILDRELSDEKDKAKYKRLRAGVKTATFGRSYGANLPTWAKALWKTVEEAKPGWERYAIQRPHLFNFTKNMMLEVKKHGYITSAFGRKLKMDKDYYAANYRIQGDAGGVLKRAQNNCDEYILGVWDGDYDVIRMILTVHDEIIFEIHRSFLYKKYEILHDLSYCMTNVPEIEVPLGVEWKQSFTNWSDAEELVI